jgi:regulatory protein
MKIDKYERLSKGKYRLYLSNGEVIDTFDDIIIENELLLKKELDIKTYNKILSDSTIYEYYNACIKYITFRIRSTKEIKDYLKRKKVDDDYITKVIVKLDKNKLLDDNNFTSCFIKDKLRFTSWGPYKIINELKKHNIDGAIIEKNYYYLDKELIYEKLNKLIDKQINTNHKLDNYRLRNKIYNNLMKLGYESNMIINILNEKL